MIKGKENKIIKREKKERRVEKRGRNKTKRKDTGGAA